MPQALYGGVIFTTSDRDDINDLSDLKDKSFAAVDSSSLGGWQAAYVEMLKDGLDPEKDLTNVSFVKTHDNVVYAVLNKTKDAGTVRSSQLERMNSEDLINLSNIKIINNQQANHSGYQYALSTQLYPEWPFGVVSGTNMRLGAQVADALIQMDQKDPAALAIHGAGWTVPQDNTSVMELLKELHQPPYN